MKKLYYWLIGGILVVALIFFVVYFLALSSVISNGGYEKGGHILFVNKSNPNILILNQQYLTGAWDGESSYRIARKDIGTGKTEPIDTSTIDKRQWVQIKVHQAIWESYDDRSFFSRERYKEFFTDFYNKGLLQFKLNKLKSFKEMERPETELPKILPHWSAYSDNTFSDDFRVHVFCINDALILNTVKKDFSLIDEMVVMKKDKGKDYTYHLYTDFTDVDHFTVTQNYKSFELESDGKPKAGTVDEVNVTRQYRISKNGKIIQTSKEESGKILVNQ
jgi:hypothetical protein